MARTTTLKRGDTFRMRLQLDVGLKGWSFTARARYLASGWDVGSLTCREIDVSGVCLVEIEGPTDGWPLSEVGIDVRAQLGAEVVHSETIQINVQREVTDVGA